MVAQGTARVRWAVTGDYWPASTEGVTSFPKTIATHSSRQTFSLGNDGLLRRHDYEVEISKSKGAHYVSDHKEFYRIVVPTKRRVYVPGPDNKPLPEPLVVSIDLSEAWFK